MRTAEFEMRNFEALVLVFIPHFAFRIPHFTSLDYARDADYYEPVKLRIGHLSTFYHTAILLMARKDIFSRLGIEAEWTLMGTGPAIMKAFGRGELDLAYIGLPPAIIAMEQGSPVVCIAGGHMEGTVMAGKSRWLGFPETDDLGAILGQFEGMAIGVPGNGSIHDVILKDTIARYASNRNILVRNYPWADLVTEAVATEEVAAAFGTPALAIAIKHFANGKILYPAAKLWPNNPSYGIIADRAFLSAHRETTERFLIAHEEAEAVLRNDPAAAAQAIADHVAVIDREFVLETLRVSPKYCAQLTTKYISSTMAFVNALKKLGYIKRQLDKDEIFDTSLIAKTHPKKDHYEDRITWPAS
jgi:NitT/TauT family transport system substrate-binding protein